MSNSEQTGKETRRQEQLQKYADIIHDYKTQVIALRRKLFTHDAVIEAMAAYIATLREENNKLRKRRLKGEDWSRGEQEARDELAAGLGKTFDNPKKAIEWLTTEENGTTL